MVNDMEYNCSCKEPDPRGPIEYGLCLKCRKFVDPEFTKQYYAERKRRKKPIYELVDDLDETDDLEVLE